MTKVNSCRPNALSSPAVGSLISASTQNLTLRLYHGDLDDDDDNLDDFLDDHDDILDDDLDDLDDDPDDHGDDPDDHGDDSKINCNAKCS